MGQLHAHAEWTSRDCDGTYPGGETIEMTFEEQADDNGDIDFMNRVFVSKCGPYAVDRMTVEVTEAGFDYTEYTEEGFRRGEVEWCHKDCTPVKPWRRDLTAEAAGY
jgi:hypothetical protein